MDISRYLAHIAEDGRIETVKQHLTETAQLAARFASAFDGAEQGFLAGYAHDIGKYSAAFQKRLHGDPRPVDHSTAGAVECVKRHQAFAALAVAGHHGGLPDGGSGTDNADQSTLYGRLNRAKKGLLEPCDEWKSEICLPEAEIPDFLKLPNASQADAVFFTRMLYSCLVDSDYLCTEAFMQGQMRADNPAVMEKLERRLLKFISGWYPPKGELNRLRCQILDQCREKGCTEKPGLFTLTVPTGGGKTVSSLAFALSHARKHKLRRIIYVIPYTSIIEQNAQVFREILGDDVVLEHHCGVLYDLEREADADTIRMAQATENWDMPIVVTTAVQFFESLFSNRSSKCRKLHNLAESVIIFDEAQMIPIPYLRPCVYGISQLVDHYHVSAVLCTATQPALSPLFREFLPRISSVELCPREAMTSPIFRRVTFCKAGKFSWDQLAERLCAQKQVLCIVNSRKGAQEIFRRMTGEGCYHLSTLMYPQHRQRVLSEIRERLGRGQPCHVVSTSLIEAGVDVDFPVVYREEAGLDSVLQAAGRCNREGKRDVAQSIVYIFEAETPPPPLFSIPVSAGHSVMEKFSDIASQEAITAYFRELLELKGEDAQDQQGILPLMERKLFPFREVAKRFRLIDEVTQTIYIPLETGEALIGRLRAGEHSRELFRQLGKYSVSVYERQFRTLYDAGVLEVLEDGSAVLLDSSLYDSVCGLSLKADSGNCFFI